VRVVGEAVGGASPGGAEAVSDGELVRTRNSQNTQPAQQDI